MRPPIVIVPSFGTRAVVGQVHRVAVGRHRDGLRRPAAVERDAALGMGFPPEKSTVSDSLPDPCR